MPPPGRVELSKDQPEESIPAIEVRPRARAERDLELLAQEQILDHRSWRSWKRVARVGRRTRSSSSIPGGSPIVPDGVLPSYRLPRIHIQGLTP
jgi:hypothetical protein